MIWVPALPENTMPGCQNCGTEVSRSDAFCGACGELVPGGTPVLPLVRESRPSIEASRPGSGAQAAVVIRVAEPTQASPTRTAIRERAEPASVLPLRRKKPEATTELLRVESVREPETLGAPPAEEEQPDALVLTTPPILASELLREQMEPSEPGKTSLPRLTAALCVAGVLGASWVGGLDSVTYVSVALMVGLLTLALTPMSYLGHAVTLFVAGGIASSLGIWQQAAHEVTPHAPLLGLSTVVLGASLLYRAYYRGAKLARIAVSIGVALLVSWFVLSGGHQSLIMLGEHWQSWGPAASHMAFALVALLALLAFMEASTRGGAHVWAYTLLALYAGHVTLLTARALWPLIGTAPTMPDSALAAILSGIAGTLVATMALAQLFVLGHQAGTAD